MKTKITHLTSVHSRYDTRIFLKECSSLGKINHYAVSLIVADNQGDEIKNNVYIYDVGKLPGRMNRIFKTTKNIYKRAIELDSDIYHLHDPELMPIGLKLKKMGKTVIFDAHEDFPKQLLGKPYLNRPLLTILSKTMEAYEHYICRKLDFIITATPFIRDKFLKINKYSIDINNYPIIGELANDISWGDKEDTVCYVGGIERVRGIGEVIKAIGLFQAVRLNLVGRFGEEETESEVKTYDGWSRVSEFGFLKRDEVADVMSRSKAGLVTFYPLPNHIDAQPNKMFEYMSAGLPIITSNFPFWKEIVEGNSCGICVDPLNPKEIANAIKYILFHPEEAAQMGTNGKNAVLEKYNWRAEEKKFLAIYKELER